MLYFICLESELTETFERRVKFHTLSGLVAGHPFIRNWSRSNQTRISKVSLLPRFFHPLAVCYINRCTGMIQRAPLLSQSVINLNHNFAIDPSRGHPKGRFVNVA